MMQPTSTTSKSSREPSQQAKDNLTVTKRFVEKYGLQFYVTGDEK